jgi:DNA-binding HxlR family transcriptional regulator
MALRSPLRTTPGRTDTDTREQAASEELLALLDADYTQSILEAIRTEAKSARALVEECGASRPTIYRRLNSLEEAGLVESAIAYDPDGHHRTAFEATLETVAVDMTDDELSVSVSTKEPDRTPTQTIQSVAGD